MLIEENREKIAQIEKATASLFQLDDILKDTCQEIQDKLEFDFAAIQLIRPDAQVIEVASATGIAAKWRGRAGHYLEPEGTLRDIQADIAQTCYTEIIAGWDQRFDRWVYNAFHHENFARIFAPIILVQDDSGNNNKHWFNDLEWRYVKNEQNQDVNEINLEWFSQPQPPRSEKKGQHIAIELLLPKFYLENNQYIVIVIGTIEVGYEKAQEHDRISVEKAVELIRLVSEKALDIRQRQLPCVLDTITNTAMEIVGADGASLHFLQSTEQRHCLHQINPDGSITQSCSDIKPNEILYVYEEFSGLIGRNFLRQCPPRKDGLGPQTIKEGKPICKPDYSKGDKDDALATVNPEIYRLGIRAIAAFSFTFKGLQRFKGLQGVLYIHFTKKHQFNESEIQLLESFAQKAENAIINAFIYEYQRQKSNQLITLHEVVNSLVERIDEEDLVKCISWNILNILAADTVTIYRYIQSQNNFLSTPALAGKFRNTQKAQETIKDGDVPFLLVELGTNVYFGDKSYSYVFGKSSFVERENIKSSAGILLKVGNQILGVMLIGYRRIHNFADEEREMISTLASSATIAIMNQRWLTALHDIDREIITSLDYKKVLRLIIQKAVQMTGADLADIRFFDPASEELLMEVWYPEDSSNASSIRMKIGEGITGHCFKDKKSILSNDVQNDPRYISCSEKSGSELCVPLLDDHRVLGVLNLESYQPNAFENRHIGMMEALASQAVIAIQNVENKEQSIATEKIVALGDFAGQLMHRINSDLGLVEIWLQKLITSDDYTKTRIQSKIRALLTDVKSIPILLHQNPEILDFHEILKEIINQVDIPSNITYKIEVKNNIFIVASRQQLIYVFCNLIQNAKEAMQNGGSLSIVAKNVDLVGNCSVVIDVSDTGEGINSENREKVFQLGYSTKSRHGGWGLWWSQVYIKRLGGTLTFQKNPIGHGTTFTVVLPQNK
jgi:GAF domain-containing protein